MAACPFLVPHVPAPMCGRDGVTTVHLKLARHMAALVSVIALLVLCIMAHIHRWRALLVTLAQRARSTVRSGAEWLEPSVWRRSTLEVTPILEVGGTHIVRGVRGKQMGLLTRSMCTRANIGRRCFVVAVARRSLTPATLVAYMAGSVVLAAKGVALADWHEHTLTRARCFRAIVCHIVLRCHRSVEIMRA